MTLSFARSLLVSLGVALLVIALSAAQAECGIVPDPSVPGMHSTGGMAGFQEGGLDKVLDSACGTRNEAGEIVLVDCPTEPEGASAASNAAPEGTSETSETSSAAPEESSATSEASSDEMTADEESTEEESTNDE